MQIRLSEHFTYGKLAAFVLPSVGMMIFTSVYGVVDGLFVSNFVGKTPFAAINLIMPLLMIISSVGFMLGAGGSALVAKTLGEGSPAEANRYFTMIVRVTFLSGALLSLIGFLLMDKIAVLLGADGNMLEHCVLYGRIVISFNAVFMLQQLFQTFFITAEKPRLGLYFTLAAGLANMVLDALFVALFRWGVAGAAVATGISQCVGGLLPLLYFARKNTSLLRFVKTRIKWRAVLLSCGNGLSEMLSNISGSLVGMVYNYQLMKHAGENGVSAYGVLMYIGFFFVAIYIGYSIGCAPIIGYNYGAGNRPELKNMLRKSLIIMSLAGLALTLLAELLAAPVSALFVGYDSGLMALTRHAFVIYSFSFLFSGVCIFISSFFTALNNGIISAVVSVLRTLVFQLAAVMLLPEIFGIDGIWFSIIIADFCAFIVSVSLLLVYGKKYGYGRGLRQKTGYTE